MQRHSDVLMFKFKHQIQKLNIDLYFLIISYHFEINENVRKYFEYKLTYCFVFSVRFKEW